MISKRRIKGLTWDHPRGFDCLAKNVASFERANPDIEVTWEARSLHDFGADPLDAFADRYDLLVIDHPFVGRAAATGCLLDIAPIVGSSFVEAILHDSVGLSADAYHYQGAVYALPTDAAAQVAAFRPDLIHSLETEVPRTFDAVHQLSEKARKRGQWIATPACPTDAMCLLLTLAANLGRPLLQSEATFLDQSELENILGLMHSLVAVSHPKSLDWNPIETFEAMSTTDEIVYVPFAFGYSNYAHTGRTKPIRFTNLAGPGEDPELGAILGGAGCAVTKSARDLGAVARYLRFIHDPAHQRGDYFEAGGQPGSRIAWVDEKTNAATGHFFKNTLATLDKSHVRPRFDGFVQFFEASGLLVNQFLRGETARSQVASSLRERYAEAFEKAHP